MLSLKFEKVLEGHSPLVLGQGPPERGWEKGSAVEGATQGADRGRASFHRPLPPLPSLLGPSGWWVCLSSVCWW